MKTRLTQNNSCQEQRPVNKEYEMWLVNFTKKLLNTAYNLSLSNLMIIAGIKMTALKPRGEQDPHEQQLSMGQPAICEW